MKKFYFMINVGSGRSVPSEEKKKQELRFKICAKKEAGMMEHLFLQMNKAI